MSSQHRVLCIHYQIQISVWVLGKLTHIITLSTGRSPSALHKSVCVREDWQSKRQRQSEMCMCVSVHAWSSSYVHSYMYRMPLYMRGQRTNLDDGPCLSISFGMRSITWYINQVSWSLGLVGWLFVSLLCPIGHWNCRHWYAYLGKGTFLKDTTSSFLHLGSTRPIKSQVSVWGSERDDCGVTRLR